MRRVGRHTRRGGTLDLKKKLFENIARARGERRPQVEPAAPFAWTAEDDRHFDAAAEDDDDEAFQWWWEASVTDVEKAAEEAEGARMDSWAASWISDGMGGDVNDVRWIGLPKACELHASDAAIWIDTREPSDRRGNGTIPGAWCVSMNSVFDYGIITALGKDLIHELLSQRHKPIIVFSAVATPFSRCRSFCRFILRAGHTTLKAKRFRRLRGGLFGWKFKGGSLAMSLEGSKQARSEDDSRFKDAQKFTLSDQGDVD